VDNICVKKASIYKMESQSGLHVFSDEEKVNTILNQQQKYTHYTAIQLLDVILTDSDLPKKAIALAREYNLNKQLFLACLAISVLEALEHHYPEEETINFMESLLSDWYASKSEKIENILFGDTI
jgi:hypothetical protein